MKIQQAPSFAILGLLALGIVAMAANVAYTSKAYAQPVPAVPSIPQMQMVTGEYTNADVGLNITLPDGWSGIATTSGKTESVITAPGGFGAGKTSPTTIMTISIITKNSTAEKTLPDSTKQPPNTQERAQCNDPTVNQATINGMSGVVTTIDCTVQGQTWKMKDYFFQTNERFIAVEFIAKTESDYTQNVGAFDSSANTLKVSNTIEAPSFSGKITGQGNGLALGHLIQHKEHVHFADNKDRDLSFDTTSNITGFNFDEGSKKLMFKVSGADGTNGTTVIHIGSFLKGPYVVTFDGAAMTNFDTATDSSTGNTTITLHYHHSTHDVTVSGTQVVPEFPLPAVAGIAAIVGVVAILGRTRFHL